MHRDFRLRYALSLERDDAPWPSLPELNGPPSDTFRFPIDPTGPRRFFRLEVER